MESGSTIHVILLNMLDLVNYSRVVCHDIVLTLLLKFVNKQKHEVPADEWTWQVQNSQNDQLKNMETALKKATINNKQNMLCFSIFNFISYTLSIYPF